MDKAMELLKQLADKLGTTVEYLWQVFVKQAQVQIQIDQIWMNVALYGYGGITLFCFILFIVAIWKEWEPLALIIFPLFIFLIMAIVVYVGNYTEILTLQTNPEYWALQEILNQLK